MAGTTIVQVHVQSSTLAACPSSPHLSQEPAVIHLLRPGTVKPHLIPFSHQTPHPSPHQQVLRVLPPKYTGVPSPPCALGTEGTTSRLQPHLPTVRSPCPEVPAQRRIASVLWLQLCVGSHPTYRTAEGAQIIVQGLPPHTIPASFSKPVASCLPSFLGSPPICPYFCLFKKTSLSALHLQGLTFVLLALLFLQIFAGLPPASGGWACKCPPSLSTKQLPIHRCLCGLSLPPGWTRAPGGRGLSVCHFALLLCVAGAQAVRVHSLPEDGGPLPSPRGLIPTCGMARKARLLHAAGSKDSIVCAIPSALPVVGSSSGG